MTIEVASGTVVDSAAAEISVPGIIGTIFGPEDVIIIDQEGVAIIGIDSIAMTPIFHPAFQSDVS